MHQLEYKTILLPYRPSVFQGESAELSEALNREGGERWRLAQLVMPSAAWGRSNSMVAILERARG